MTGAEMLTEIETKNKAGTRTITGPDQGLGPALVLDRDQEWDFVKTLLGLSGNPVPREGDNFGLLQVTTGYQRLLQVSIW